MQKWKVGALLGIVVLIVIVAIYQSNGIKPTEEGIKDSTTVKVVLQPYISFSPFFIAKEEGYFEEQGIEVEFVKFLGFSKAMPVLAQGDLDVGAGAGSASLFNAIARGINIKIVADKAHLDGRCDYAGYYVRKDLFDSGEITEIAQLKGNKVASSPLSTWGYVYSEILNRGNLSLEDIEIVELRGSETLVALQTKAVAAAALGEPFITKTTDMGLAVKLISYQEAVPGLQLAYIVYGPNLLEKDPELGKRFMVAYLKGVRQYNEGKTERNIQIIQEYTKLDRDIIERSCWPPIYPDGHVNMQSLLELQNWSFRNGYIDALLTEDQLLEKSFVEYANKVIGN